MRRNMPRLYNTEWPNQSTFSCNDSAVTQCQPPLVSHATGHLSLPIDSRLQLDVTNGSDLGLGSDSTVGDGFDLAPSLLANSSVNYDSDFNPYPQLKKMRTS
ncbi:hypothetical protein CMV_019756 [Castanea mollissima]|uniref:Uncharacterized protein n=1 Tax=Castanea mollissima TaxID=60419 RepID=A0A8J4QJ64_9ROSI|nr:hypothetical protein CMV_019756 [Castanea mollissima]